MDVVNCLHLRKKCLGQCSQFWVKELWIVFCFVFKGNKSLSLDPAFSSGSQVVMQMEESLLCVINEKKKDTSRSYAVKFSIEDD